MASGFVDCDSRSTSGLTRFPTIDLTPYTCTCTGDEGRASQLRVEETQCACRVFTQMVQVGMELL